MEPSSDVSGSTTPNSSPITDPRERRIQNTWSYFWPEVHSEADVVVGMHLALPRAVDRSVRPRAGAARRAPHSRRRRTAACASCRGCADRPSRDHHCDICTPGCRFRTSGAPASREKRCAKRLVDRERAMPILGGDRSTRNVTLRETRASKGWSPVDARRRTTRIGGASQ